MDPNATLAFIQSTEDAESAATAYLDLVAWVDNGGFLPSAWDGLDSSSLPTFPETRVQAPAQTPAQPAFGAVLFEAAYTNYPLSDLLEKGGVCGQRHAVMVASASCAYHRGDWLEQDHFNGQAADCYMCSWERVGLVLYRHGEPVPASIAFLRAHLQEDPDKLAALDEVLENIKAPVCTPDALVSIGSFVWLDSTDKEMTQPT